METNLVSIIIPTYNRGHLIKETIISVLNQTYQNFEILIIDDCSTDNTKEIIESIKDNRIKYFWINRTGLPAKVRNYGLKIAKGEFIALLDSDDLWIPNKLEKQINAIQENQEILLVSTNGITFPHFSKFFSFQEDKIIPFIEIINKNLIITSSILMKREIIDAVGLFDENKYINSFEDYDYWLRILNFKDKSILILKDILIKYRLHESNISIRNYQDTLRLLKKYIGLKYIFNKYDEYENEKEIRKNLKIMKQLKTLILKNLFFNKKDKRFLIDRELKYKAKIIILITFYFHQYIKQYFKIDFNKSKLYTLFIKRIYSS